MSIFKMMKDKKIKKLSYKNYVLLKDGQAFVVLKDKSNSPQALLKIKEPQELEYAFLALGGKLGIIKAFEYLFFRLTGSVSSAQRLTTLLDYVKSDKKLSRELKKMPVDVESIVKKCLELRNDLILRNYEEGYYD